MRTVACALLAVLALADTVRAQGVRIGISAGRGGFSAQPLVIPSYRPYPRETGPYGGIPLPPPPVVFVPDRSRELERLIADLPQVPPPDELAILRRPPANLVGGGLPKEPIAKKNAAPLLAPRKALNKVDAALAQVQLGRDAFADGEPGTAAERFRKAIALKPDDAEPRFLLAQSLYALGRYREAVVEILDGLKRKPDWSKGAFDVRDLYGRRPADHALDLETLRQAVERNPDEPALAFLYGYELWFNGRQKEARPYLDKAAARTVDPAPIQQFVEAK